MTTINATNYTGRQYEVLWCLFRHGPTWDGNIPSKQGRDELVDSGLAERGGNGYQWLTRAGVELAIKLGMDRKKEKTTG